MIKAGLAEEDVAVILGALVVAAEALGAPDGDITRRRYRQIGDAAFSQERNSAG